MKTSDISVEYVQHCGDDLAVVNAARVSFDKESEWDTKCVSTTAEQLALEKAGWKDVTDYNFDVDLIYSRLKDSDTKLIKYLASHGHISPFHHAFITMRIKAPVFVARQLVKHKFMPINEVSRRYVDSEPEFFWPTEWRGKAENVKQGSGEAIDWNLDPRTCIIALETYQNALKNGVCPEQARMILPLNLMTEWIWSGTLSAWASMLNLRLTGYTQKETRDVAEKAYSIIQPLFPVSIKALVDAH